jgi:hypothetical protein
VAQLISTEELAKYDDEIEMVELKAKTVLLSLVAVFSSGLILLLPFPLRRLLFEEL